MSEKLDLTRLEAGLQRLEDGALAAVPVEVLRRLVRVAQGVRMVEREARVALEHPRAMDDAQHMLADVVRAQVECVAMRNPNTHPATNEGTVRVAAYVLDPLAARHL